MLYNLVKSFHSVMVFQIDSVDGNVTSGCNLFYTVIRLDKPLHTVSIAEMF